MAPRKQDRRDHRHRTRVYAITLLAFLSVVEFHPVVDANSTLGVGSRDRVHTRMMEPHPAHVPPPFAPEPLSTIEQVLVSIDAHDGDGTRVTADDGFDEDGDPGLTCEDAIGSEKSRLQLAEFEDTPLSDALRDSVTSFIALQVVFGELVLLHNVTRQELAGGRHPLRCLDFPHTPPYLYYMGRSPMRPQPLEP